MMAYSPTARSFESGRAKAYQYAAINSQSSIEYLRRYWIEGPGTEVDSRGNTLLHLVVTSGNEEALKALMEFVSLQQLKKQNTRGDTALHEAARHGHVEIARALLGREMCLTHSMQNSRALVTRNVNLEAVEEELGDLVSIQNKMGEIPLYVAAASGHDMVFQLLEYYRSDFNTQREDGCTVLHAAIMGEFYIMAISISKRYPQLAHKPDMRGNTPLNLLATSPASFKSGTMFKIGNLGKRPFIPLHVIAIVIYRFIQSTHSFHSEGDPQEVKRNKIVNMILGIHTSYLQYSQTRHLYMWFKALGFFILYLLCFLPDIPFIRVIDQMKQKNLSAEELARILIEQEADWSYYSYTEYVDDQVEDNSISQVLSLPKSNHKFSVIKKNGVSDPLIQAIEKSIPELVQKILEQCPDSTNCIDDKGRNILHLAAEYKNLDVYELLKRHVVNKERMMAEVDFEGNTILHQATIFQPTSPHISLGIFYATCWDVFWFTRISGQCLPHLRYLPNKEGQTAMELFIIRSKRQREDSWKAMKDINNTLMVVAALIGTISFASLFTVPGGYNQKYGYPLLLESDKRGVELFLGYDAITLYASTFALGSLLSIQISWFKVEEFCIALPLKYLFAVSALYYAACFTVATTIQAIILEECLPKLYVWFVVFMVIVLGWGYIDSAYYVFLYSWVMLTRGSMTSLLYQTF